MVFTEDGMQQSILDPHSSSFGHSVLVVGQLLGHVEQLVDGGSSPEGLVALGSPHLDESTNERELFKLGTSLLGLGLFEVTVKFSGACQVFDLLLVARQLSTQGHYGLDILGPGGYGFEGHCVVCGDWRLSDATNDVLLIGERRYYLEI